MSSPTASEIILASSPAGNAVMHIYAADGSVIETQTGDRADLEHYAETRFPNIQIKDITK